LIQVNAFQPAEWSNVEEAASASSSNMEYAPAMLAPEPHHHPPPCRPGDERRAARTPNPLLWPLIAAATVSDAAASYFGELARAVIDDGGDRCKPEQPWTTPHAIALELATARLRDFSTRADGVPTLVCTPYALHGAVIADFAPGHSLVATLREAGLHRVYLAEWRSAGPDMRFLTIDNYLADLNVMVDELTPPVDLVGLCQGGWMALVYAARFPGKVRRLVLAGAPVDVRAGHSMLSDCTEKIPLATFAEMVRLSEGRVIGSRVLELWGRALAAEGGVEVLQLADDIDDAEVRALGRRLAEWYGWTLDLPGPYYLQVVSWLFKENRIAQGSFPALGRAVDLAGIDIPILLMAARDDTLVAVPQLLGTARLVSTPPQAIETIVEPCGHLSLFIGRETLHRAWGKAARWLQRELPPASSS
jgi:poly(3-hydroxyalkanoate) synthetase